MLLPWRLARLVRALVRDLGQVSMVDLAVGLAESSFPSGLYTTAGIERYVRTMLGADGRSDDFRLLGAELYLAATDLDTCERIVFGSAGWDDVPISTAVSASSALPMLYKPVDDQGPGADRRRDPVDDQHRHRGRGGRQVHRRRQPARARTSTTSTSASGRLTGSRARRVSDMGFPQIGYQTFKLLAYQRLHEMARHWEERFPGVDIILIEPEPNDELMFQTGIMSYASPASTSPGTASSR